MPSLKAKRKVTYAKSDINAIDGVIQIIDFSRQFDGDLPEALKNATLRGQLNDFARHIEKQRKEKPAATK